MAIWVAIGLKSFKTCFKSNKSINQWRRHNINFRVISKHATGACTSIMRSVQCCTVQKQYFYIFIKDYLMERLLKSPTQMLWWIWSENSIVMGTACSANPGEFLSLLKLLNCVNSRVSLLPSSNQAIFCNTSKQGGGCCCNPLPRFSEPNPLWNWFWYQ